MGRLRVCGWASLSTGGPTILLGCQRSNGPTAASGCSSPETYCQTEVPVGVVEAANGKIKALLRRGRGHRALRYLLLKGRRIAALKTESVALRKAKMSLRAGRSAAGHRR
jgi:hypothetical protein